MPTDTRLLLLSPGESVYILCDHTTMGEVVMADGLAVFFPQALGLGHKTARLPVAAGERVIKYGAPIGRASRAIAPGDHVHLHNLVSDDTPTFALGGELCGAGFDLTDARASAMWWRWRTLWNVPIMWRAL